MRTDREDEESFNIFKLANGYVVMPHRPQTQFVSRAEQFVFQSFDDAARFLKQKLDAEAK